MFNFVVDNLGTDNGFVFVFGGLIVFIVVVIRTSVSGFRGFAHVIRPKVAGFVHSLFSVFQSVLSRFCTLSTRLITTITYKYIIKLKTIK